MRLTCNSSLGSAGVLARRGFLSLFAGLLLLAVPSVQAQVMDTNPPPIPNPNFNLNPNPPWPAPNPPPLPPLPPPIAYKDVAPGVTLHQASPVLYFRGILGMSPVERDHALAEKPADSRKILLAKVEEYKAMPAEIREARLRQTQLRWELITLTNLPSADRHAFIEEVTLEDRPLLRDFDLWLTLSPAGKQELLAGLAKRSPTRHQALIQALAQWQSVPETERRQSSAQFSQFCDLNQTKQQKVLTALTDAERRTMETALKVFAGLPEAERKICIQSFQRFASMDAAQRDEFLKNAALWEAMTASERSLWQALVQKFPKAQAQESPMLPPSPPGFYPVLFPPSPPGLILGPPPRPGTNPPVLPTASNVAAAVNRP